MENQTIIALCQKRNLPAGKRQDGFVSFPAEYLYDLVAFAEVSHEQIGVAIFKSRFFVRTNMTYGGKPLFQEEISETVKENAEIAS
jgi:hypothetical protein